MNLILIQNSTYRDYSDRAEFLRVIDFNEYNESATPINEDEIEVEEFEWALDKLHNAPEADAIIISSHLLSDSDKLQSKDELNRSAYSLATHIRLSKNQDGKLPESSYLPVVILTDKTIDTIVKDSYRFPSILKTTGCFIADPEVYSLEKASSDVNDESLPFDDVENSNSTKSIYELIDGVSKKTIQSRYTDLLDILEVSSRYSTDDRHGIANQYGAYRLAEVAGLSTADFKLPKTLYFKYLLAQHQSQKINSSDKEGFWDHNLKVLFIDDQEHKGWSVCLKQLLEKKIVKERKSVDLVSRQAWCSSLLKPIGNDEFDLIFLDLYPAKGGAKGDEILRNIKQANPVVPVIMFTASNKAWNMDKLYEAGADGYYVKEHPEMAKDVDLSIENYNGFYETIKNCLEKGERLRPYWRKIKESKANSLITNRSNELNKERIEERLIMFLGLLKKDFEQTKFDKGAFFYSDLELAFLTLWSTLNEIQQVYYETPNNNFIPFQRSNYPDILEHPCGRAVLFPNQKNWKIKDLDEYLYKYGPELNGQNQPIINPNGRFYEMATYSKLFLDDSTHSGFREETSYMRVDHRDRIKNKNKNYSKNLFMQIAYLIKHLHPNQSGINRELLMQEVLKTNSERNKLYLTHGEDTPTNYEQLLREGRSLTKEHCKQLFEIVYFLVTGKQCLW